jgi:hypothetical protein
VCELDSFEAILNNTFLDTTHVDVLKDKYKLKTIIRLDEMLVNLEVEYQVNFKVVGIHFISLQELQETSFFIFMQVNEFSAKAKAKGLNLWPNCISNIFNKHIDV